MTAAALDDIAALAATAGLTPLACSSWPPPGERVTPPSLAGFVFSSFSPLAAEVANACLTLAHGGVPAPPARGERTAIIIASSSGDLASAVHVAAAVDAGARPGPLLFFQSVPNAIAGHIAARWGLAGPVVCLSPSPSGAPLASALAEAALLCHDGDADEALIVLVEQDDVAPDDSHGPRDRAHAVLVAAHPAPHNDLNNEGAGP